MSDPIPPEIAGLLADAGTRARLGAMASTVVYYRGVGSTNDVALELAGAGAEEGTTVLADEQSAGRGRNGRTWFSPSGGLYMSVVLHQPTSPSVTLLAGVAAAEGLRVATGVQVEIEWPNDLVVAAVPERASAPLLKLGGILCEAAATEAVVLGIGVNLSRSIYPVEIANRAACLDAYQDGSVSRSQVLVEILSSLAAWRARAQSDGLEPVLERWRALSPSCSGVMVAWDSPEGRRSGVTAGLDPSGALQVQCGEQMERIVAGRVEWIRADTVAKSSRTSVARTTAT